MFDEKRFYRVTEVAEILGVSRQAVAEMEKEGRLPPRHAGSNRFRGDQLAAWVRAGKRWDEMSADEMP